MRLSEIAAVLPSLAVAHHSALSVAANQKCKRSVREAHSAGVTSLLGLSNPIYSSTAPSVQSRIGNGDAPRRYWTSYWRYPNWAKNAEYESVAVSGGNSFRRCGVSAGDVLYVISQLSGQLLLGGRLTVGDIVSRDEAVRITQNNELYDVDEWVVGEQGSGTALYHHRQLEPEVTKRLRFVSGPSDPAKPLTFVNDRDLDRQTARGVRQLTLESSSLLDEIIEMTDDLPRSIGLTTISAEHLRLYIEGSLKQELMKRYERAGAAREDCIRHYGYVCSACEFDFRAAYGKAGADFIHVHHLIPLSKIGRDYEVNPLEDLRPVCPNCHAIIHRHPTPYSIEEVRGFLELNRVDPV
jgi:predicted HNH restriction endonuclease